MPHFLSKNITLVLAALLIVLYGFFWGQRMDNFGSLGDEQIYTLMTLKFPEIIHIYGLNDYRVQRIIPSAAAYYAMKLFHAPLEVENVITTFGIFNIILSVGIAVLWCLIAKELKLSVRGRWLGFLAIFVNFHILKYIPYVQVMTDIFAYFITFGMIYFYLRNNWLFLWLFLVIGCFIWPTVLYTGLCLLLFRCDDNHDDKVSSTPFGLNYIIAALVAGFVGWQFWTILKMYQIGRVFEMGIFAMGATHPLMPVIYLSMGLVLVYVLVTIGSLLQNSKLFQFSYWKQKIHFFRLIAVVLTFVGIKWLVHHWAVSYNARPTDYLIKNLLFVATMQPMVFLVNHVIFFGPLFAGFLFLWKPICRIVQAHGIGLVMAVCLVVIFGMDSETRKQMNTYPIVLPFLIKAMDSIEWKNWQMGFWVILSLVFSRVWLKFASGPWTGTAQEFPSQSYYMTMGPWMSHPMYYLQGTIVLVTVAVIYFLMFGKRKTPA